MITESNIIELIRKRQRKPGEGELKRLPYRKAFIYGRVSSPSQVRDSHESIREIARLVELAIRDGYRTNLDPTKVEQWLLAIQKGNAVKGILEDGEVIVDIRDLGISGQLSADSKEGLSNLQRQVGDDITGCVYLTEGVSRLSRDRDKILPFQLLKLLKDHQCRIRTPDGIWNPAIEKDWDYLADEFDYAVDEGKVNTRRLYRRRKQKAARGEYAGGLVMPGFIVEIKETAPSGRHIYGKYRRYPPHADIAERILKEYIRQGFSETKTHRALDGLLYPPFPPELQYMERLSALRKVKGIEGAGYRISPSMINSVATNPVLIGIWTWGDIEPIPDNHEKAVPVDLWLEAFNGYKNYAKPRGRSINHEPLEWAGLLLFDNLGVLQKISPHSVKEAYRCQEDYVQRTSPSVFNISAHYLDIPLTNTVLGQLKFTPFAEEVLMQLEADTAHSSLELEERKKSISRLEHRLENLEGQLGWEGGKHIQILLKQIEKTRHDVEELQSQPIPTRSTPEISYKVVRDFLIGLPEKWYNYSRTLRNRLLRRLIERVILRQEGGIIKATIYWKTGQTQAIEIQRARSKGNHESRWKIEEFDILKKLWPNSSRETMLEKLPGRTWKAITHQAYNLGLRRSPQLSNHTPRRRWESNEDDRARQLYEAGTPITDIASKVGRSYTAVLQRSWEKGWRRPLSGQRVDVTKLSSTNQNPTVPKRITSGLLFGGQVSAPNSVAR